MSELSVDAAVKAIRDAWEEFGSHNYYDKGADEVLDMHEWQKLLVVRSPEDVRAFLEGVHRAMYDVHLASVRKKNPNVSWTVEQESDPFVSWCVMSLDSWAHFEALLDASPILSGYY